MDRIHSIKASKHPFIKKLHSRAENTELVDALADLY